MNYSAIIPCGGKGSRMNIGENKIFCKIDNKTIIERSIDSFINDERCKQIVIVANNTDMNRLMGILDHPKICFTIGGRERLDSVYNGLIITSEEYVLIHDGARPYLTSELVNRIIDDLSSSMATICAVPVKDTIKIVSDDLIVETPNRSTLWNAQTPQAFYKPLLISCYKQHFEGQSIAPITDDASLIEIYSDTKVHIIKGDYRNIKITTIEDLPQ